MVSTTSPSRPKQRALACAAAPHATRASQPICLMIGALACGLPLETKKRSILRLSSGLSKRHVDREQPSARLSHARQRLPRAWRVDAGECDPGERRQSVYLVTIRLWGLGRGLGLAVRVGGWGRDWGLAERARAVHPRRSPRASGSPRRRRRESGSKRRRWPQARSRGRGARRAAPRT